MTQASIPGPSSAMSAAGSTPLWMLWTGRVISGLLAALFAASAVPKFIPSLAAGMEKAGWSPAAAPVLGMTEMLCAVLYAIPQTSVLGAILLTGYMGGAIATHARIGEAFIPQIVIGVLVWVGLFCEMQEFGR